MPTFYLPTSPECFTVMTCPDGSEPMRDQRPAARRVLSAACLISIAIGSGIIRFLARPQTSVNSPSTTLAHRRNRRKSEDGLIAVVIEDWSPFLTSAASHHCGSIGLMAPKYRRTMRRLGSRIATPTPYFHDASEQNSASCSNLRSRRSSIVIFFGPKR